MCAVKLAASGLREITDVSGKHTQVDEAMVFKEREFRG